MIPTQRFAAILAEAEAAQAAHAALIAKLRTICASAPQFTSAELAAIITIELDLAAAASFTHSHCAIERALWAHRAAANERSRRARARRRL